MYITEGYLKGKLDFRINENDPQSAVRPEEGMYYRDKKTSRIYVYDVTTKEFRDLSFFQGYKYTTFESGRNADKYIDSNRIYLAKPGQRILGVINGIDEDSCSLTKNLNNTSELTFTVQRILNDDDGNGVVTQYYDKIERHYELYLPYHGWFKINEEPEIENDGTIETKSVRAESLEIELQQYDLVDFEINSGSEYSREMLAVDNTFDNNGYNAFHDQVLFYRDTTLLENDIREFAETDGSIEALKSFALNHAEIIYQDLGNGVHTGCWRITYDGEEVKINPTIDPDDEEFGDYTGTEILEMELQRQRQLSLLWLILHEHGWNVGFVDPYIDLNSDLDDDKIPLQNKVGFFQVSSQDIYSFLTQDVAQYFRCIFVFDTENYLVHAYNINNVGYDTNIFLSFRNIQNEVTRTSDRDLHTVFHVQGGDELDFTEANFGENQIEDISHFLNDDHFPQDLINKYNGWQSFREDKRQEYMQLSVNYRDQLDTINELTYRVPIDGTDGNQYKTMTEDELINEKANMRAMRYAFEHNVIYAQTDENDQPIKDENGDYIFDIEKMHNSVDWPIYSSLVDIVLSYPDDEEDEAIEHIEFKQGEESDEYEYDFEDTYKQTYSDPPPRLGQIDTALLNLWIISGHFTDDGLEDVDNMKRMNVKNQKEFFDDYKFDFETYGYLYGLEELQNFEKTYQGSLSALDDTGYDESDGSIRDQETYAQYEKYKNAYDSVVAELEIRQQEVDDAQNILDNIVADMDEIKEQVAIKTWTPQNGTGFTEEELLLLDKYYLHTDYVNQDIFTTSISTNQQIVDTEYQLYLDAMEELYVESHPQYTWSTTQDNLLLMPEFHDWHGDLHVGNFIRISFRDDYQVKLRLSSITLNPLMLEPTISLEFTTMTNYKSKRNDFTAILDQANASTKNAITSSISKKSGTDNQINVDAALVLKLLNSPTFSSYMGTNNSAVTGSVGSIVSNMDISVGKITGTTAEFEELFSNYISSNFITTKMLQADDANIENLTAKIITVGGTQITEDLIQTANLSADQITSGEIDVGRLNVGDIITVGTNSITTIAEGAISTAQISAEQITSGTINADRITSNTIVTKLISAESGDFQNLTANSAFIQKLNSGLIEADVVSAGTVIAALVDADVGDFNQLTADHAFVQYLQSQSNTAIESKAATGYFYDLVAGNLTVGDLATHTASADQIVLISQSGDPAIAFQGATQQFYDDNGNVRVQIGQDGNGDFNFIVRGADGTSALFNENGITQNGIPNNTIINNMISNSTIQKGKLAFDIIEPNAQGGIDITQVYDGSGNLWGVQYTTFKQGTEQALGELSSAVDDASYRLYIETPNGKNLRGGNITLNAKLYYNSVDVTSEWGAQYFTWKRKSLDTQGDTAWNHSHSTGTKSITLTSSDVNIEADFECCFEANGVSVSSNGGE